jgi:hypothetical protein
MHLQRVNLLRQFYPQQETGSGYANARTGREAGFDSCDDG